MLSRRHKVGAFIEAGTELNENEINPRSELPHR